MQSTANYVLTRDIDLDASRRLGELKSEFVESPPTKISLDGKEHVKALSSKVSVAVGLLRHAKPFLPEETLTTLYTGIIEPHFRYCCFCLGMF